VTREASTFGVVFNDAGDALPAHPSYFVSRLACRAKDNDPVAYAVQKMGFVHVAPIRDALLISFEPSTVHHLAAFAAFYEVAGRAPKRLILCTSGKAGSPDRYEIFNNVIEGLKRLEAALSRDQGSIGLVERPSGHSGAKPGNHHEIGERVPKRKPSSVGLGPGGLAVRVEASDYSKRLSLPLDAISPKDQWFGQLLNDWRNARSGWRLPSTESLDTLELLNIARGRAHIVDIHDPNPVRYRFRVWGTVNSYCGGHTNKCLGEMPAGLMREKAVEDYWEVATTGVPTYKLISHTEKMIPYSYARLLLPLAADGRQVDRLVVLINERPLPELEAT
jgi:hypothetical protein